MPGVGPVSVQRVLDFIVETADPIGEIANAPMPPRVGGEDWSPFVETVGNHVQAAPVDPPNWSVPVSGTSPTSTAFTKMPSDLIQLEHGLLSIDPPYARAPIPDLTTDLTPSSCCTSRWWRKTSVCTAIAALAVALLIGPV